MHTQSYGTNPLFDIQTFSRIKSNQAYLLKYLNAKSNVLAYS